MKKTIAGTLMLAGLWFAIPARSQERHDKGVFIEGGNKYYEDIKRSIELFNKGKTPANAPVFKMDFSQINAPVSANEFNKVWAGNPVSQGATNTCWSFSTTSFYESEVKRLSGREVKLSEQFIAYWEFTEKAREYVRTRGASFFGEGSETNAVARIMKKYGEVPFDAYSGYRVGQKFLDHTQMFPEMEKYLEQVKASNAWNEELVVSTIRSIMDHYMGPVPQKVKADGKEWTPLEYVTGYLKLNPDDYVNFMSLMQAPYWSKAEYDVPDNWWNSTDYNNVPLDVFMGIVKESLKKGFTLAIGGDVSESGILGSRGIAVVPTYDIPAAYIDENARQLRFTNGATTDDHAIHVVGWVDRPDGTWFLIKDSGSGAHNNPVSEGYYYYHEDYVKLKMMTITIHKDAVRDILAKIK